MTVSPPPQNNLSDALRVAAAGVHTPESFGRAIIAEALRLRSGMGAQQSEASIAGTISISEVDPSTGEQSSTHHGELLTVCLFVGDHLFCVHVQPPIHIHAS